MTNNKSRNAKIEDLNLYIGEARLLIDLIKRTSHTHTIVNISPTSAVQGLELLEKTLLDVVNVLRKETSTTTTTTTTTTSTTTTTTMTTTVDEGEDGSDVFAEPEPDEYQIAASRATAAAVALKAV